MVHSLLALLILSQSAPATEPGAAETSDAADTRSEESTPLRDQNFDRAAKVVVERTNAYRRGRDLGELTPNETLNTAAQSFAEYMARTGNYGHEADGRAPAERIEAAGYVYCRVGENIGWQQKGTEHIASLKIGRTFFTGWRDSPPHHENIVEPTFTEIGTGFAAATTGRYYAVQLFGRPQSLRFTVELVNQSGENVRYQFGGEMYELTPRMWRQHEVCETTPLVVGDLEARDIAKATRLVITRPGDTFAVAEEGEPRDLAD